MKGVIRGDDSIKRMAEDILQPNKKKGGGKGKKVDGEWTGRGGTEEWSRGEGEQSEGKRKKKLGNN